MTRERHSLTYLGHPLKLLDEKDPQLFAPSVLLGHIYGDVRLHPSNIC